MRLSPFHELPDRQAQDSKRSLVQLTRRFKIIRPLYTANNLHQTAIKFITARDVQPLPDLHHYRCFLSRHHKRNRANQITSASTV